MALMTSPDGKETIDVPDALVAHYQSLGATPAQAPGSAASRAPAQPPGNFDFYDYVDPGGIGVGAGGVAEHPGFGMMSDQQQSDTQRNALIGYGTNAAMEMGGGLAAGGVRAAMPFLKEFVPSLPVVGGMVRGAARGVKAMRAARQAEEVGSAASRAAPGLAPAVAESAPAGLSAIKPLRANASEAARTAHRIEVEAAMSEAKLDAQARRAIRDAMGHGKPGRVAGKIEPSAQGPKATAEPGSAASRASGTEGNAKITPRHEVQYYSESQGKYVDIEDLNQRHIELAYKKLAAKNPKPGSVGKRVLDALLNESKHRLQTTGIHVGQTGTGR